MPFHVIEGTFHVVGYSPDGDSIRFKARRRANWRRLDGPDPSLNSRQHAQLRIEAIDTLETHYHRHHQPRDLADAATDRLLTLLGIRNVRWDSDRGTVRSADDGVPGYIVSRLVEGFGRPVCFAFSGRPDEADGSQIFLSTQRIRDSVNYKLLKEGHAYPTYYSGLFADLRETMTTAAQRARQRDVGVWPYDWSDGVTVESIADITESYVIVPKLFRRLAQYVVLNGRVDGFKTWLESKQEPVLIIDRQHFTHFDTVVYQDGRTVGLTEEPENLMFLG